MSALRRVCKLGTQPSLAVRPTGILPAEQSWELNNQPNAPRGYAPRGQTPVIKQMAKRFGRSVMSAVSNRGSARWMVCQGALNAALLIRFMERLVRSMQGRKACLILDNLRVHHSKPVKAWLEQHRDAIAVHHLPSYSPELIPSFENNLTHVEARFGS